MELPEQKPIGKYGRMHLDDLKQHRRGRYSALLGEGRLNAYLADVDEQAQEMLTSLTVELAKTQGTAFCKVEGDEVHIIPVLYGRRNFVQMLFGKSYDE